MQCVLFFKQQHVIFFRFEPWTPAPQAFRSKDRKAKRDLDRCFVVKCEIAPSSLLLKFSGLKFKYSEMSLSHRELFKTTLVLHLHREPP